MAICLKFSENAVHVWNLPDRLASPYADSYLLYRDVFRDQREYDLP
jgi:hypothetical protein